MAANNRQDGRILSGMKKKEKRKEKTKQKWPNELEKNSRPIFEYIIQRQHEPFMVMLYYI